MPSKALSPLNATHTLYLSGNKWHCDCKMRNLRQILISMEIIVPDEPKCYNFDKIWTKLSKYFLLFFSTFPNTTQSVSIIIQGNKQLPSQAIKVISLQ